MTHGRLAMGMPASLGDLPRHQMENVGYGIKQAGAGRPSRMGAVDFGRPSTNNCSSVNEFHRPGDRVFIQCDGGPCLSRLEYVPPQLEIEERGGTYILIDEGEMYEWRYLFVPNEY